MMQKALPPQSTPLSQRSLGSLAWCTDSLPRPVGSSVGRLSHPWAYGLWAPRISAYFSFFPMGHCTCDLSAPSHCKARNVRRWWPRLAQMRRRPKRRNNIRSNLPHRDSVSGARDTRSLLGGIRNNLETEQSLLPATCTEDWNRIWKEEAAVSSPWGQQGTTSNHHDAVF